MNTKFLQVSFNWSVMSRVISSITGVVFMLKMNQMKKRNNRHHVISFVGLTTALLILFDVPDNILLNLCIIAKTFTRIWCNTEASGDFPPGPKHVHATLPQIKALHTLNPIPRERSLYCHCYRDCFSGCDVLGSSGSLCLASPLSILLSTTLSDGEVFT